MIKKASLTHEIILPSRGLVNPEIPEGKITQRCMMVYDQKYLAGINPENNGLKRLLKETTVSPTTIDIDRLTIPDIVYMILSLRILSYGDEFKFTSRCPACGKLTNVTADLSKLEVYDLDEEFKENLIVKLPYAGDTVYTRLLRSKDLEAVNEEASKIRAAAENPSEVEGIDYILRLCKMVSKISLKKANADGDKEITDPVDIRAYIENLTDRDANAIQASLESVSYGSLDLVENKCAECGTITEIPLRVDTSFFRPQYDLPIKRHRR